MSRRRTADPLVDLAAAQVGGGGKLPDGRYGHLFPTPDHQHAMAQVEQRVFG